MTKVEWDARFAQLQHDARGTIQKSSPKKTSKREHRAWYDSRNPCNGCSCMIYCSDTCPINRWEAEYQRELQRWEQAGKPPLFNLMEHQRAEQRKHAKQLADQRVVAAMQRLTLARVAAGAGSTRWNALERCEQYVGAVVKIRGLVGAPQHNGKLAAVVCFIAQKGRYKLRLLAGGKRLAVKPGNVELVSTRRQVAAALSALPFDLLVEIGRALTMAPAAVVARRRQEPSFKFAELEQQVEAKLAELEATRAEAVEAKSACQKRLAGGLTCGYEEYQLGRRAHLEHELARATSAASYAHDRQDRMKVEIVALRAQLSL